MMPFIVLATVFWGAVAGASPEASLSRILDQVKEAYKMRERPVVLVRLEDTLFDARPRMSQLLNDYAKQKLVSRPKDAEKIKTTPISAMQDTATATLSTIGLSEPAIVNGAQAFWFKHRNEDGYLQVDTPSSGAVSFIRALYSAGARVLYYSERDISTLQGTNQALRAQGFPIGIFATELVMKPLSSTQDAVFKQQLVNYVRHYSQLIAVFTSNANDVNIFKRAFPAATCVYYAPPTTKSDPTLLPDVYKLTSFTSGGALSYNLAP
jgi:hypothetical protein